MAQILEFPYGRIRQEDEHHEAQILKLPVKQSIDPLMLMPMFFAAWIGMFQ